MIIRFKIVAECDVSRTEQVLNNFAEPKYMFIHDSSISHLEKDDDGTTIVLKCRRIENKWEAIVVPMHVEEVVAFLNLKAKMFDSNGIFKRLPR